VFYQAHGDSCRIPLKERDGLFKLDVNDWSATAATATTVDPIFSKMPGVSFAVLTPWMENVLVLWAI
jgi:hypothetical protein